MPEVVWTAGPKHLEPGPEAFVAVAAGSVEVDEDAAH
jgi:hypothetical protein